MIYFILALERNVMVYIYIFEMSVCMLLNIFKMFYNEYLILKRALIVLQVDNTITRLKMLRNCYFLL